MARLRDAAEFITNYGAGEMIWESYVTDPTDILHVGLGRPGLHWKKETALFLYKWPEIHLVGVEANPLLIALAYEMHYPGELFYVLAWDTEGKMKFNMTVDGRSSVFPVTHCEPTVMEVPTYRMDDLEHLLGDRIFLHMDVEGSEDRALRGCEGMIREGRIPWIWVELNLSGGRPGQADDETVKDQLRGYGMKSVCTSRKESTTQHYDELWVTEHALSL